MKKRALLVFLITGLVMTGCGGGGGGGSTPVPPRFYDGLTTAAVISQDNAMGFVNVMFGTAFSAPDIGAGVPAAVSMSATLQKLSDTRPQAAGVSRVPVNWVEPGLVSGTETCSGSINYDLTGFLTCDYVNYNNGDGFTLDGRMIIRIFDTDDFSYEITHAAIELWTLRVQSAMEDVTLSGILDSVYDIPTITYTDTMNVDGVDNASGEMYRYENLTAVQTCDASWMPTYCTESVSGRIYLETDGYVDLSATSPLEYHYMGQFNVDVPDAGGPMLMTGATQTGIRMTPLSIVDCRIEIDIDSDPDYEYTNTYTWYDMVGLVITFEKTYGSPTGFDGAYAAIPTDDHGYIAAGWTNTGTTNAVDFLLVKTDGAGSQQWSKTLGGTDNEYAMAVRQTTDGGYVVAGYVEAFPNNYGLIYKVDAAGNEVWSRPLSSDPASRAYDIIATSDGGYLVTGYRETNTTVGLGWQDLYLVKLDANGAIVWENVYGGTYTDIGHSVIEVGSGGFLAVGSREFYTDMFDQDIYLVRVDAAGGLTWETSFGGPYTQYGFDVIEDAGNFAVTGTTYDAASIYGYAYALYKVDGAGSVVLETSFDATTNNLFRTSITSSGDGGYIVVGNESFDVDMFKLDSGGNIVWQRVFNWSNYMTMCTATSVEKTPDGGFIIGGSAWPSTGKDVYLIKTDANGQL